MQFPSNQKDILTSSEHTVTQTVFGTHLNQLRANEDAHRLKVNIDCEEHHIPTGQAIYVENNLPCKWAFFLQDVDFDIARDKFVSMFAVIRNHENAKGETMVVITKIWDAPDPYLEHPCCENALAFIEQTNGKCCMNIFKSSKRSNGNNKKQSKVE